MGIDLLANPCHTTFVDRTALMATPRKTVQVEQVLKFVNEQLRCNHWSPETKQGMYIVLDRILHDTEQYAGFNYFDSYDPEDPEFQIGGKKEVSRQYHLKSRSFKAPKF